VGIDFLVIRLKPRVGIIINTFNSILCAVICGIVGWYGMGVVWGQFQRGLVSPTLLGLPLGPLYIIIPIAFFLLFIQFLRRAVGFMSEWRSIKAKVEDSRAV
jgi:TRAP-type C4-dicarboxylate transport system permease small subunit